MASLAFMYNLRRINIYGNCWMFWQCMSSPTFSLRCASNHYEHTILWHISPFQNFLLHPYKLISDSVQLFTKAIGSSPIGWDLSSLQLREAFENPNNRWGGPPSGKRCGNIKIHWIKNGLEKVLDSLFLLPSSTKKLLKNGLSGRLGWPPLPPPPKRSGKCEKF